MQNKEYLSDYTTVWGMEVDCCVRASPDRPQRMNESSAVQITWLTTNLVCRQGSGNKTSWQEADEWKEEKRCPWSTCGVYIPVTYFYIHTCFIIFNIPVPAHLCVDQNEMYMCSKVLHLCFKTLLFKFGCFVTSLVEALFSLHACPPCVWRGSTYCWCDILLVILSVLF